MHAEPVVQVGIYRSQLQGPAVAAFRAGPVPFERFQDHAHGGIGIGQTRVQIKRAFRRVCKAKTNERVLMVTCFIVLAGHWLDLYLMVLPPVLKGASPSFGVSEVGRILLQFGIGHMACWPVFMNDVNLDQELPQAV